MKPNSTVKRLRPLERRVALWLAAASSLGLLVLAAAVMASIAIDAREDANEATTRGGEEEKIDIIREVGEGVFWALLVAMPVSIGMSVAGAVSVSRRAFAPLRAVTKVVNTLDTKDLSARITTVPRDLDLEQLVIAFNALLDRVESSSSALNRYSSEVSHELRTPLAIAVLELEVALRRPRSKRQWEETATKTLEELQHLTRLVESLLSLARLQNPAGLALERFMLVDSMAAIEKRAKHFAAEKSIHVGWNSSELAAEVSLVGSRDLIATALWNLVGNALEHVAPGGTVSVLFETEDESTILLTVDDDGPGLLAGMLPWLTKQALPTTTEEILVKPMEGDRVRHKQGLGLGLPLTNRIAKAHGGSLSVTPSSLGGVCFCLRLSNKSLGS